MAECVPLNSAALGKAMANLPGEKCCSAVTAWMAHGIAVDPNLPMPWSALAGLLDITSCTAEAWEGGECSEEPYGVHIGDEKTMKEIFTYICIQWDAGCNTDKMTGTAVVATDIVVPFQAPDVKAKTCALAGVGTSAPAAAPLPAPEPMGPMA